LEVNLVDRGLCDLSGEACDEEALVIAGGSVGGGRAVAEGVSRAIAVGAVVVGEVVIDKYVVALIDVIVQAREEEVLLLEAGGRRIAGVDVGYIEKELDAVDALRGADTGCAFIARGADNRALVRSDVGAGSVRACRSERDGVGVGVEDAADFTEAVVGEEEEETVFEMGPPTEPPN